MKGAGRCNLNAVLPDALRPHFHKNKVLHHLIKKMVLAGMVSR